jgi:hypothetical protein
MFKEIFKGIEEFEEFMSVLLDMTRFLKEQRKIMTQATDDLGLALTGLATAANAATTAISTEAATIVTQLAALGVSDPVIEAAAVNINAISAQLTLAAAAVIPPVAPAPAPAPAS